MEPLLSVKGVRYLPDEGDGAPVPPPRRLSFIVCALVFFLVFAGLQLLWDGVRNTAAERMLIDDLLVRPAALLVNLLTPRVGAIANGQFLTAPGGGLQVVSACVGSEVYFMLTAALIVFPLRWRARIVGIALGLIFVFALNQARMLALFYAYRSNLILFDYLHGIFLPILLILLTCLFVLWWTASHAASTAASATPGR
jgi:exosortase/archaeosortase family protein